MRARTVLVGGVAMLTLLVTACAEGPGGAGPADPTVTASAPDETTGPEEPTQDPTDPAEPTDAPALPLEPGAHVVDVPEALLDDQLSMDAPAGAAWTGTGSLVYVVTFGSGSCPTVADPQATEEDGAIAVTFPAPSDGPCTMDYRPATTVVELPDAVLDEDEVTLRLGDLGEVTLPERTDGEPSALVWVDAPAQ